MQESSMSSIVAARKKHQILADSGIAFVAGDNQHGLPSPPPSPDGDNDGMQAAGPRTPEPPPSPHVCDITPPQSPQDETSRSPMERRAIDAVTYALCSSDRFKADFVVTSIVGFGSHGVVVAASTTIDDETTPVAIKIIYRSAAADTCKDILMRREAQIMALVTPHPNILRLHQSWEDARHIYICTDLVDMDWAEHDEARTVDIEDTTLRITPASTDLWCWSLNVSTRLNDPTTQPFTLPWIGYTLNPPPIPIATRLIGQIISAVAHLHAQGIAHGDIKEENVLVCPHRGAIVADFGLATRDVRRTHRYGTPQMSPPELLPVPPHASRPTADPFKADVFAVGVLAYSILHGPGVLPEVIEEGQNLGSEHLRSALVGLDAFPLGTMRPDVPIELLDAMRGMTMVDPRKRWTMKNVILSPWYRAIC